MRSQGDDTNVLGDALKGAIAGAIGVWVMDQIDWYMYDHEDPRARERTRQARPNGMDPAHVGANRIAAAMGRELSPKQPHPAGIATHYMLGVGPGALYGAMLGRVPGVGTTRGAVYGLGLFLMQDEALNSMTGLAGRPNQYPWQAHARGLVSHLVYGLVTDTVLRVLKGPGSFSRYADDEQIPSNRAPREFRDLRQREGIEEEADVMDYDAPAGRTEVTSKGGELRH